MKKLLYPILIGATIFLPQLLSAGGGGGNNVLVRKCQGNVDPAKKQLSARVALECVKKLNENEGQLLNKISGESPDEAADLVSYNNALVDLANLTSKYSGYSLAEALAREMESDPCPLCDLGLGPQPEKAFNWVSANVNGRLEVFEQSVRSWDALGAQRTAALAAEPEHYNKNSWGAMKIMARYQRLSVWARAQTDMLVLIDKSNPGHKDLAVLGGILREDLVMPGDSYYTEKLDGLGAGAPAAALKGGTSLDKKTKEAEAVGKTAAGLSGLSTSGQKDYLDTSFDKTKPGSGDAGVAGGAGRKFIPVPITEEQAAALSGKMGSNTYNNGWWQNSDKTTRINTSRVDQYCEAHGITPAQMLESEEHLKGVARYVAPNFVHETTHQRQDAWAGANGLDYLHVKGGSTDQPFHMEQETEAFSMQAAFSAEKAKKLGPLYLEQIPSSHKENAMRFMEDGVDKLRTDKQELYPAVSSLQGSAAKEFRDVKSAAAYLRILEDKKKKPPGDMTEENKADLKIYREKMNTRFKWYTMLYQKSAQDEKKLLQWRGSFSGYDSLTATPPPGLGSDR